MNDTRAAMVQELKTCSGCTVEYLAESLGITPTAVRQHLSALERDGLVEREKMAAQRVGRPGYVYHLSAKASDLFPTAYRQLAIDLVEALMETGGEHVLHELLHRRRQKMADAYGPALDGRPLAERVETLAHLRTSAGYMTEWEALDEDDSFRIRERHCPVLGVASCCREMCEQEVAMFADLLDAQVVIEEHMPSGSRSCCYRISANR